MHPDKKTFDLTKTKEQARQCAIYYQNWSSEQSLSWGELLAWQAFFTLLAKKFKLTKEFKENGII